MTGTVAPYENTSVAWFQLQTSSNLCACQHVVCVFLDIVKMTNPMKGAISRRGYLREVFVEEEVGLESG